MSSKMSSAKPVNHSCTGGVPCVPPPPGTAKSRQAIQQAIDKLDLDCIKIKLMDSKEGKGWTREQADRVERQYKRFLFMAATMDQPFVPTDDIDEFWHTHILDTQKYTEDCQNVFGYFLHHFPYFGMRGEEDAANLRSLFEASCHAYEIEYGESYVSERAARPTNPPSALDKGTSKELIKPHIRPSFATMQSA